MDTKCCSHCGIEFKPKYPSSKLCYHCWRKREDMFETYDALERDRDYWRRRAQQAGESSGGEGLDLSTIERLIRLCHPDKHNGSKASTEVTQWLMNLRKKFKRAA